jgi:hypothetical protein
VSRAPDRRGIGLRGIGLRGIGLRGAGLRDGLCGIGVRGTGLRGIGLRGTGLCSLERRCSSSGVGAPPAAPVVPPPAPALPLERRPYPRSTAPAILSGS